ncbi:hypothetical protein UPYG_G00270960 [Umbra pygmaea]|uniref:FAM194 C-terminal domain-containing protein n=1 Tax=Umbra pygmaea TaxID=75934 RepID=A0ABD0WCF6_UMBPY
MIMTDFTTGPVYFFDQPTGLGRTRSCKMPVDHYFNLVKGARARSAAIKSRYNLSKDIYEVKINEVAQKLQNDASTTGKPEMSDSVNGAVDISSGEKNPEAPTEQVDAIDDINPMDTYKRVAPYLLSELGSLLQQFEGREEGCIPHGLVNVLNDSWYDLTAGAVFVKPPPQVGVSCGSTEVKTPRKSKACNNLDESLRQIKGKRKTKTQHLKLDEESERKLHQSNLCKRASISHASNAQAHTTISFSMSSKMCEEQGWIIQPKEPCCKEQIAQSAALCQWVVERLQRARRLTKLQIKEQTEKVLNIPPILRYYGEAKPPARHQKTTGGSEGLGAGEAGMAWLTSLLNGMPQMPYMTQEDHDAPGQKLHCRINDGSSFIYYPSGHVAVCQSHSGLSSGGFYTNVFSDHDSPVILASITALGRGAVTHPLSGAVVAVWGLSGGLISDPDGAVIKEWTWHRQTRRALQEEILIQVSDQVSVRLLSGTRGSLSFTCQNERVHLPLSALSLLVPPEKMACLLIEPKAFSSLAAEEFSLARIQREHLVQRVDRTRDRAPFKSVPEKPEEPCSERRQAGRELRRLQKTIHRILDDWLEFYHIATGIKCPDTERISGSPVRPRQKTDVRSVIHTPSPPTVPPNSTKGPPDGGSTELQTNPRNQPLSALADFLRPGSTHKMPWTFSPRKCSGANGEEPRYVTQAGSFRVQSNIKLDPVVMLRSSPELHPETQHHPPSTPQPSVSPCPAQLRAILRGEESRARLRCHCSSRLMPVLTDLEYDAFIWGQPPHSQQLMVVCVTHPRQIPSLGPPKPTVDKLDELYQRRNKNRTIPCTQSQLDSFRLLRYELSTGKSHTGTHNALLQQRHNAAPGMFLMYIRGKLLFADYIFNEYSCSVRDFLKQISKTRRLYRLGQCLPPDYSFSGQLNSPNIGNSSGQQGAHLKQDKMPSRNTCLLKKENTNQ